ncbi:MAG: DUF5658 family protein [Thermoleophilia bacterium]
MICTAGPVQRHKCGTRCDDCGYLRSDRRVQRVEKVDWSISDRRLMSNWVPHGYRMAGSAFTAPSSPSVSNSFIMSVITLLLSFNILDCVLTSRALTLGFEEGNPLMASLFRMSMPLGMTAKVAIVAAGALTLWRFRHLALAVRGMSVVTACYGAVVIYHLSFQLTL